MSSDLIYNVLSQSGPKFHFYPPESFEDFVNVESDNSLSQCSSAAHNFFLLTKYNDDNHELEEQINNDIGAFASIIGLIFIIPGTSSLLGSCVTVIGAGTALYSILNSNNISEDDITKAFYDGTYNIQISETLYYDSIKNYAVSSWKHSTNYINKYGQISKYRYSTKILFDEKPKCIAYENNTWRIHNE